MTTRLCLDRLRLKVPVPSAEPGDLDEPALGTSRPPDPVEEVELAESLALALRTVVDQLTPAERIAFVLHDTFDVDHRTLAGILGRSEVAVRKLVSRARTKVAVESTEQSSPEAGLRSDADVVDAFLAAARAGDFARLLELLDPDALTVGDDAAVALGTPALIEGRTAVATMFDGAAKAALPVLVGGRAAAAWVHRGEARVVFDFTLDRGVVRRIDFRADPAVLAGVVRRRPEPSEPRSHPGDDTRHQDEAGTAPPATTTGG